MKYLFETLIKDFPELQLQVECKDNLRVYSGGERDRWSSSVENKLI